MIRTILTAMTLAAAVYAAPAGAKDGVGIKVGYSGLNLGGAVGATVLQHRINAAVAQICGSADIRDLQHRAVIAKCRQEVSADPYGERRPAVAKARQTVLASAR